MLLKNEPNDCKTKSQVKTQFSKQLVDMRSEIKSRETAKKFALQTKKDYKKLMLNKIVKNKTKIHTRDIRLATYPHTDSRVIVHGILKDWRYIKVFDITGKVLDPGVIHHMDVKLLINSDPLMIEDVQAQMLHVPMSECRCTLDTIEKLKGIKIEAGFSKNIRSIMGGKKKEKRKGK